MVVNSILVARSLLSISWLLAHTIFLLVLFDCNKKLLSMRSKDRLNGLKKLTGE